MREKTLKILDLKFVNIGGGFGIPYKNEEPLDLMEIIDNKISEGADELSKKVLFVIWSWEDI